MNRPPLRFFTYATLQEHLLARRDETYVALNSSIMNSAISEYRMKHGRFSERGMENVRNEIQGRVVVLMNECLSSYPSTSTVVDMVLNQHPYVIVVWAIAMKLKKEELYEQSLPRR